MTTKITPTKELADFLGTTDKKEQLERIKRLTAPVVDVIVRHDMRSGDVQVRILGSELQPSQVKAILRLGTDIITQKETQDRIEAASQQPLPDSPPSKPKRVRRRKTSPSSEKVSSGEDKTA